jgi:hypothetical protein
VTRIYLSLSLVGLIYVLAASLMVVAPGWAETSLVPVRLNSAERRVLKLYYSKRTGLEKAQTAIENQSNAWHLKQALVTNRAQELHEELASQFKDAAWNITVSALANATHLNQLVNKLPKGSLGKKLKRIMRSRKVQKLLEKAELLGNSIQEAEEKLEEYKGRLEELEHGQEVYNTLKKDGLWKAVKNEIKGAIESKIEEIIPIDFSQPKNEVAVDGLLHLAGKVPAAAYFVRPLQEVANATKKLVRIYGTNLSLNNLNEEMDAINHARTIQAKMVEKFRSDPVHSKLMEILDGRYRAIMADSESRFLSVDLEEFVRSFRKVKFGTSKYADNKEALPILKELTRLYKEQVLIEKRRARDELARIAKEKATRIARELAEFREAAQGSKRKLARDALMLDHFVVAGVGNRARRRGGRTLYDGVGCLAGDEMAESVLGCAGSMTVHADAMVMQEVQDSLLHSGSPTKYNRSDSASGVRTYPDSVAKLSKEIGVLHWTRVSSGKDVIGQVKISGPGELKGHLLKPTGPGIIEPTLTLRAFGKTKKKSFTHLFRWTEVERSYESTSCGKYGGRRRAGFDGCWKVVKKRTKRHGSQSIPSPVQELVEVTHKPKEMTEIPVFVFSEAEFLTAGEELIENGDILDLPLQDPKVRITFTAGPRTEVHEVKAGMKIIREEPTQVFYKLWIEGKEHGRFFGQPPHYEEIEVSVVRPKASLKAVSPTTRVLGQVDTSILARQSFGPARLEYHVEGELVPSHWEVIWKIRKPQRGTEEFTTALRKDNSGFHAEKLIQAAANVRGEAVTIYAELRHKATGTSLPELRKQARLVFHYPLITKVELASLSGGRAKGGDFWVGLKTAQAMPTSGPGFPIVVKPLYTDETGRKFDLTESQHTAIGPTSTLHTVMSRGDRSALSTDIYNYEKPTVTIKPQRGRTPGAKHFWAVIPSKTGLVHSQQILTEGTKFRSRKILVTKYVAEIKQGREESSGTFLRQILVRGPNVPKGLEVEWPLKSGGTRKMPLTNSGTSASAEISVLLLKEGGAVHLLSAAGKLRVSFQLKAFREHEKVAYTPVDPDAGRGFVPLRPRGGRLQGQGQPPPPQLRDPTRKKKVRYEIVSIRTVEGNNPLHTEQPYRNYNDKTAETDDEFVTLVNTETASPTSPSSQPNTPPDACGPTSIGGTCNPASAPCVSGGLFAQPSTVASSMFMGLASADGSCLTPPTVGAPDTFSWNFVPGANGSFRTHRGWNLLAGGTSALFTVGTTPADQIIYNVLSPTGLKVRIYSNVQLTTVTTRDAAGNVISTRQFPALQVIAIRLP